MENKGQMTPQEARCRDLMDRYLKGPLGESRNVLRRSAPHLDEDSLSAFIEGQSSEREAQPMVSHLVDCSFCRHVTAELVRLDLAFAENARS